MFIIEYVGASVRGEREMRDGQPTDGTKAAHEPGAPPPQCFNYTRLNSFTRFQLFMCTSGRNLNQGNVMGINSGERRFVVCLTLVRRCEMTYDLYQSMAFHLVCLIGTLGWSVRETLSGEEFVWDGGSVK